MARLFLNKLVFLSLLLLAQQKNTASTFQSYEKLVLSTRTVHMCKQDQVISAWF